MYPSNGWCSIQAPGFTVCFEVWLWRWHYQQDSWAFPADIQKKKNCNLNQWSLQLWARLRNPCKQLQPADNWLIMLSSTLELPNQPWSIEIGHCRVSSCVNDWGLVTRLANLRKFLCAHKVSKQLRFDSNMQVQRKPCKPIIHRSPMHIWLRREKHGFHAMLKAPTHSPYSPIFFA